MKINQFFRETLGANLKNPRWSWGAFDPITNRMFLRLWQDQIDGDKVQVYWKKLISNSNGLAERLQHIETVKGGAQGIGVVCRAVNPESDGRRTIADFDESLLIELGDFIEDEEHTYAHINAYISIDQLSRSQTSHSTLASELKTVFRSKKFETNREAFINARIGQGDFRSAVLQLWENKCAVTGSAILDAIRASHIKPWRDSNNSERLDP